MRTANLTRVLVPGQPPRYFPSRRDAEPFLTHHNRNAPITGTAEVQTIRISANKDGICALLNRELLRKEDQQ